MPGIVALVLASSRCKHSFKPFVVAITCSVYSKMHFIDTAIYLMFPTTTRNKPQASGAAHRRTGRREGAVAGVRGPTGQGPEKSRRKRDAGFGVPRLSRTLHQPVPEGKAVNAT